jgi:hypothetical protein
MRAKWPLLPSGNKVEDQTSTLPAGALTGRPLTVSLQVQAAETHLPKLIWMKHRIESLLQAGKDREAHCPRRDGESGLPWRGAQTETDGGVLVPKLSLATPALLPRYAPGGQADVAL